MMNGVTGVEIMRKIQEQNRNCGVKLRSREESQHRIMERLLELETEELTDSQEYRHLSVILSRSTQ